MGKMKRHHEQGFSMVEVVLALGLLAGVLISIAGLFILGTQQVESGRTATEALSVARGIIEEIDGWGFRQTYQLFGVDGSAATTATVDTRAAAYAAKWQTTLDDALFASHAEIAIESLGPVGGPVPPLDATRAIRVVVTVFWDERGRSRQIRLGTVRM
jgi:type II secretory pathway pseudopilin PulG